MYPFRILVVKIGNSFKFRVVYQKNRDVEISTRNYRAVCSACPQILLHTIYLRGDWHEEDNKVHIIESCLDVEHMLNEMNKEIKSCIHLEY